MRAYDASARRYHVLLSPTGKEGKSPGIDTATPRKVFSFKQTHLQLLSSGSRFQSPLQRAGSAAPQKSGGPGPAVPWERHVDPLSGMEYFYNTLTQVTTWDPPLDAAATSILPGAAASAPVAAAAAAAAVAEATSAWVIVSESAEISDEHGNGASSDGEEVHYYLHRESGETQWQPPRLGISDEEHTEQHNRLKRWARHWDDTSSLHYWVDLDSGQTQWHAPCPTPTPKTGPLRAVSEPEEWQRHFDKEHQIHYYVHNTTGETSWEHPGESLSAPGADNDPNLFTQEQQGQVEGPKMGDASATG